MRRWVAVPVSFAFLFLGWPLPQAGAQLPPPPSPPPLPLPSLPSPPPLPSPIEDTLDQVESTVAQTSASVETTADSVGGTGGVGSAGGGSGERGGGGIIGTGDSAGEATSATGPGGARSNPSGGGGTKVADKAGEKGGNGKATVRPQRGDQVRGFPAAPPLVVTKTNDADGDFTFTDAEIATKPGATIPFEVSVLNQANDQVTIGEVVDYLPGAEGVRVCNELTGQIVAPDGSATCTFTLEAYSPANGSRAINTIRVQGTVNHNGATVSSSDSSTVTTLGGEVFGLLIQRPPELGSTGAAIIGLLRLAALLGGVGVLSLAASRARGRLLGFPGSADITTTVLEGGPHGHPPGVLNPWGRIDSKKV
jgi:hypothetical protein